MDCQNQECRSLMEKDLNLLHQMIQKKFSRRSLDEK
jgi:hypothetical protein